MSRDAASMLDRDEGAKVNFVETGVTIVED